MKLNFNFESRENHFLTSGISHPRWYLSPRFTVILVLLNNIILVLLNNIYYCISKNQKFILYVLPTTPRATLVKGTSSLRSLLLTGLFRRLPLNHIKVIVSYLQNN